MISLCPSGRLLSFIAPSQNAQFLFSEGTAHVLSDVSYQTSYQGLLDVPREPLSPKPRYIIYYTVVPRNVVHDVIVFVLFSFRPTATATLIVPIAFKR